jgi:hypothetical protein
MFALALQIPVAATGLRLGEICKISAIPLQARKLLISKGLSERKRLRVFLRWDRQG